MQTALLNIAEESDPVTSVEGTVLSRELDFDRLPNFIPFGEQKAEPVKASPGGDIANARRLRRLMAGVEAMRGGYNPHGREQRRSNGRAPEAVLTLPGNRHAGPDGIEAERSAL